MKLSSLLAINLGVKKYEGRRMKDENISPSDGLEEDLNSLEANTTKVDLVGESDSKLGPLVD
jgi:hypothetical protein